MGLLSLALLATAIPASAHLFNHQDRHEVCDLYRAPQAHGVGDGHAHWHHLAPVGAHFHAGALFPESHAHADVFHDPCDQAGMLRYAFADAPAYVEPPLVQTVIGTKTVGHVDVVARDIAETIRVPVPSLVTQQTLTIHGDADLARFPGSGTPSDPYVIEGYHIRNALTIKDTSKCVVVRNNVIYNDAFRGPIVDPSKVVDLEALAQSLGETIAMLLDELAAATDALAAYQLVYVPLEIEHAELLAQSAALQQQWDDLQAVLDGETWALQDLNDQTLTLMGTIGDTRDDLQTALASQGIELPATPNVLPADPAFASFLADVAQKAAAAVQNEEIDALRKELDQQTASYDSKVALIGKQVVLVDEAQDAVDAFEPGWIVFQAQRDAWLLDVWQPAVLQLASLQDDVDDLTAYVTSAQAQLADVLARLEDHLYEYLGLAFDTLFEVVEYILDDLPAANPNLAGRLVLDWNGQCVHVYHNLVQDLRVNQNNARTGYATGGLIENNRIFDVGQIRHYDGEFRENEIGDRKYIDRFVVGTQPAPPSDASGDFYAAGSPPGGPALLPTRPGRVINADGFNEAWMHHNVIYGSVDLDLHGHHHGPGFFARESHYHGDVFNHAYMANSTTGACLYPTPGEPGPLGTIGVEPVDALLAGEPGCLPHHDHAKRWTSVRFESNVILDPLGYGLRYEDQNHEGDDRVASSESMVELDRPHFHRTHVSLADNVVMGSIWVDVFNADGIELWSDDYSEVKRTLNGAIIGLVDHFGAEIVESHPARNDGWLDIVGNTVFVVDKPGEVRVGHDAWSALQLAEGKEMNRLELADNAAYFVKGSFDAGVANAPELTALLLSLRAMEPRDAYEIVQSWPGKTHAHAPSHAILLRDVADSLVRVCGNAMLGFARGLEATSAIRPDVGFDDCGDNAWGDASPSWAVSYTEDPPEEERLLDPLYSAADGTPAESQVHSLHDHATMVIDP